MRSQLAPDRERIRDVPGATRDTHLASIGAVLLERSAVSVGLMAAAIAVGGFIGRAYTVLRGDQDQAIRRATIVGGLVGLMAAVLVILLDVVAG